MWIKMLGWRPITAGELPDVQVQPDLTSAMMAQSQALLTLVGHLAQGADPVLDSQGTATSSSRGSQTRQRLQAELASHSGAFAEKVKEKALLRMPLRGGGLHRAFLTVPLLRAVWRVRQAQGPGFGRVAGGDRLRSDDGGEQQRRMSWPSWSI